MFAELFLCSGTNSSRLLRFVLGNFFAEFRRTTRLSLLFCESVNWFIFLNVKAMLSFDWLITNYSATRNNNPDYLVPCDRRCAYCVLLRLRQRRGSSSTNWFRIHVLILLTYWKFWKFQFFSSTRIFGDAYSKCFCYVVARTDARGAVKTRHDTCRIGGYAAVISGV
jgi:hypothetical protein